MHNACVRYGGHGRCAFSLIIASHALRCFVLKTESISLRLTHALTHNRKNRCGNKGHKSRYARIFPRGKPTKGLEICTFCVFTTFVISRSRVQVTSPAPKTKELLQNVNFCGGSLFCAQSSEYVLLPGQYSCFRVQQSQPCHKNRAFCGKVFSLKRLCCLNIRKMGL